MKLSSVATFFLFQALLGSFTLAAPIVIDGGIENKRSSSITDLTSRSIQQDSAVQLETRQFGRKNKSIKALASSGARAGSFAAGSTMNKQVQAQTGRLGGVGTAIGMGGAKAAQGARNGGARLINSGFRGVKGGFQGLRNGFNAIGGGFRGQRQQATPGQPQGRPQGQSQGQPQNQRPRPPPGLLPDTQISELPVSPSSELPAPVPRPGESGGRPMTRPQVFTG